MLRAFVQYDRKAESWCATLIEHNIEGRGRSILGAIAQLEQTYRRHAVRRELDAISPTPASIYEQWLDETLIKISMIKPPLDDSSAEPIAIHFRVQL